MKCLFLQEIMCRNKYFYMNTKTAGSSYSLLYEWNDLWLNSLLSSPLLSLQMKGKYPPFQLRSTLCKMLTELHLLSSSVSPVVTRSSHIYDLYPKCLCLQCGCESSELVPLFVHTFYVWNRCIWWDYKIIIVLWILFSSGEENS